MGGGGRRRWTGRTLDAALALGLAIVAMTVVRERLVPLWRELRAVDPGGRLPRELRFTTPDGRSLEATGGPTLLFFYLSSCPACERAAPSYRGLAEYFSGRTWAVALSDAPAEVAWAAQRIPEARTVRLESPGSSLRRLRVDRVPATLVLDREGRLVLRRMGSLSPSDLARIRAIGNERRP